MKEVRGFQVLLIKETDKIILHLLFTAVYYRIKTN